MDLDRLYKENCEYKAQIEQMQAELDKDIRKITPIIDFEKAYEESKEHFNNKVKIYSTENANLRAEIIEKDKIIEFLGKSKSELKDQIILLETNINLSNGLNPIDDRDNGYSELKAKWDNIRHDIDILKIENESLKKEKSAFNLKIKEWYDQLAEIYNRADKLEPENTEFRKIIHSQNDSIASLVKTKSDNKILIENLESQNKLQIAEIKNLTEKYEKLKVISDMNTTLVQNTKKLLENTKEREELKDSKISELEKKDWNILKWN